MGNSDFGTELKKSLRESWRLVKCAWPHLLSHHPHCDVYERDVLHLGGVRLCAGCFIAYPTAIAVIIYALVTGIYYSNPWYFFGVPGILLGFFQFLSLYGRGERFRHVIKFLLGLGIGLTTISVFRLPVHVCLSSFIMYALVMLAAILGSRRIMKMEDKCKECPHVRDWQRCPGMKKVYDDLGREGLV